MASPRLPRVSCPQEALSSGIVVCRQIRHCGQIQNQDPTNTMTRITMSRTLQAVADGSRRYGRLEVRATRFPHIASAFLGCHPSRLRANKPIVRRKSLECFERKSVGEFHSAVSHPRFFIIQFPGSAAPRGIAGSSQESRPRANEDHLAWGAVEQEPEQWNWQQHDAMEKRCTAPD